MAANILRELILDVLEMREDFYLSKLAEKLDKEGSKTNGHDDAWGGALEPHNKASHIGQR